MKPAGKPGAHGDGMIVVSIDPALYTEFKGFRHGNITRSRIIDAIMYALAAIIGIGAALSITIFLGFYTIPSESMEDTLLVGDKVIATQMWLHGNNVNRGDVIVFTDPGGWLDGKEAGGHLCKRVIGLPGDTITVDDNGNILVNGKRISEPYLRKGMRGSEMQFSVHVTPGNVFVLGDNRTDSADSRYHMDDDNNGLVPMMNIDGIIQLRYWPFNRISTDFSE